MIELLLYLFAGLVVGCIFLIITYKTHDCVTGEDLLAFFSVSAFLVVRGRCGNRCVFERIFQS